ncbi:MAG: hypothetical protein K1X79_00965 [Oligoflexia bacterium]|nr:hypothetical protein [Oligoflexia bacterium]
MALKLDKLKMKSLGKLCKGKLKKISTSNCDLDKDGLVNRREVLLKTSFKKKDTDGDRLSDYVEVAILGTNPRKKDSDKDGLSDGDEVLLYGTDPLDPDSDHDGIIDSYDIPGGANSCAAPNFDSSGNTNKFEIPTPLQGNISAGQAQYQQTCHLCHADTTHGQNFTFPQLQARITSPPMNLSSLTTQQIANLVAFLNKNQPGGTGNCTPTPTPGSGTPQPTAAPTEVPGTPCPGGNYDGNGNTTAFGIPTGLTGNVIAGLSTFTQTCGGCHGSPVAGILPKGVNFSYQQLVTAVTGAPMNITTVTSQQFANLTAAANQSQAGGNCGTPAPTPTPLDPVTEGNLIFNSTCRSCHSNPNELHSLSLHDLNEALNEVNQMQNINLTNSQKSALIQFLHTQ